MKKTYILLISLLALAFSGCEDHEADVYKGQAFVQFKSPNIPFPVMESGEQILGVEIGVSQKSNVDQTFNVSVDPTSTAVAGVDYELIDRTVTIPAGKFTASIGVKGFYENATTSGKLLKLKLDADAALINPSYGNTATVNLYQFCAFNIDELVGMYLCVPGFPYDATTKYEVEFVKTSATTGHFVELYDTGFNVAVEFFVSDPTNFYIKIAPQAAWMDQNYGEIYVETKAKMSPFSMCNKTITLNLFHSVPGVGSFGEKSSYLEKMD